VVTIANTIYDAVGFRITDLPITPQRVLAAIKNKKGLISCGIDPCGIDPLTEKELPCILIAKVLVRIEIAERLQSITEKTGCRNPEE